MRIIEITRERFPEWRRMRHELYGELSAKFHEAEMELIFSSKEATCFIGLRESGAAVAMLEVSLRNFVDGCPRRARGLHRRYIHYPAREEARLCRRTHRVRNELVSLQGLPRYGSRCGAYEPHRPGLSDESRL